MKDNSWNNVELRDNRYNQIVHMVSAAKGAEEYYSTEVGVDKKNAIFILSNIYILFSSFVIKIFILVIYISLPS